MEFTKAACAHDAARNQFHHNALRTISRFMGDRSWDYAEFFYGRLVSGWTVPF